MDIEGLFRNTKQRAKKKVLKINLSPEKKHEILNINIKTVSEQKEICRRRKVFFGVLDMPEALRFSKTSLSFV